MHLTAAATATTALAEDVAEDVAEAFKATAKTATETGATHVGIDPGVAVLVVGRLLLRVGQHLVGFLDLLELGLRFLGGITLVAVRVVFHGQLAVGLLDFVVAGIARNAEHFVIVAFRHDTS